MKKKLVLGLTFFAFIQCIKEINIQLPEHHPQLVVNGLFQPDSLISVSLGKSKSLLDDTPAQPITNASILLYENSKKIDSLVWYNNKYRSKVYPDPNTNYRLLVYHQEDTLSTGDLLPNPPLYSNVIHKDSVYFGGEGEFFNQLSLTIIDNPDEDNFYELTILTHIEHSKEEAEEESQSIFNSFVSTSYFDENNNDYIIQSEGLLNYYPETLLFSDKHFSSPQQELNINYRPRNLSFYDNHQDRAVSVILKLRAVSSHYYQYKRNLTIHLNNQESDLWDGTGEPISVYSNVTNGLGIFAGYNEVIDTLQKRFPQ